jgi:hypothetical protein
MVAAAAGRQRTVVLVARAGDAAVGAAAVGCRGGQVGRRARVLRLLALPLQLLQLPAVQARGVRGRAGTALAALLGREFAGRGCAGRGCNEYRWCCSWVQRPAGAAAAAPSPGCSPGGRRSGLCGVVLAHRQRVVAAAGDVQHAPPVQRLQAGGARTAGAGQSAAWHTSGGPHFACEAHQAQPPGRRYRSSSPSSSAPPAPLLPAHLHQLRRRLVLQLPRASAQAQLPVPAPPPGEQPAALPALHQLVARAQSAGHHHHVVRAAGHLLSKVAIQRTVHLRGGRMSGAPWV